MLYDTHCHPYLQIKKSQEEILERFFLSPGRYLNSIWVDIPTSKSSALLAKDYPQIFASIGIHPTSCLDYKDSLPEVLHELKNMYLENSNNIVAIWECGLDYHWLWSLSQKYKLGEDKIIEIQKTFFRAQIHLARELSLPFIIHNRNASKDVFQILIEEDYTNFVFHCYSENLEYAKKLINFAPECKLWFGWVVTFKNAQQIQETAKHIPLKNIIIETDAPYLTPVPYRGKQENEPLYTQFVLEKIIELRGETPEEITKVIFENSVNMFIKK